MILSEVGWQRALQHGYIQKKDLWKKHDLSPRNKVQEAEPAYDSYYNKIKLKK